MKNKNIALLVVLVIILIVLAGLAFFWSSVRNFLQPGSQEEPVPAADTTPEIERALDRVDIQEPAAEFQEIDADLNSL